MRVYQTTIAIAITAASAWSGQSPSATAIPTEGSIKWRAERAREQGEASITIRTPRGMFEKISSLDQALSIYEVLVGTPVASVTEVVDNNHIYTWYKLEAVERLILHPNPEVPAVPIPEILLPVAADEIVIHVPQGTVTIEGVRVTAIDSDSRLLTLHGKYLFFLSPDSSGKFAYLRAGPNAIFLIKPDNQLAPLVDKQSHMQLDLAASTGGSLDSLRQFAKAKAAERLQYQ